MQSISSASSRTRDSFQWGRCPKCWQRCQCGNRDRCLYAAPLTVLLGLQQVGCLHTKGAVDVVTRVNKTTVLGSGRPGARSEEHTSELQSRENLVCRLLLEKKKKQK